MAPKYKSGNNDAGNLDLPKRSHRRAPINEKNKILYFLSKERKILRAKVTQMYRTTGSLESEITFT